MSVLEIARAARRRIREESENGNEKNEKDEIKTEPTGRPTIVPAHCLSPSTCCIIGICGRLACIPEPERVLWVDAVETARSPNNPHRVPEFDPGVEEGAAA